jgi:hypothetical protein
MRCIWQYGIKTDLREIGWMCVRWIHLAQERVQWWDLVKTVMKV